MLDFTKLKTPPDDGDVLIEPPRSHLRRLAESNYAHLSSISLPVLDTDIQRIRAEQRTVLCPSCSGPIVMTGHQPEFIHAGVWAKHVVASRLADTLGGRAVNFVVDSDVPNSGTLEIPAVRDNHVVAHGIPNGLSPAGAPFEHRATQDKAAIERFATAVRESMGPRFAESCMPRFLEALADAPETGDWVDQMVCARRSVERDFGIDMVEHRISRVFGGPMTADMMLHAARFSACYNIALSEYRRRYRVRSANRPIPDLHVEGTRIELPLWIYRPRTVRQRLFVEKSGNALLIFSGRDRVAKIAVDDLSRSDRLADAFGACGDYVIRPRALAVTLWARLFAGDLFIHGIGGAKYDRITDALIRRYYEVEPPSPACVSATLRSDLPSPGATGGALRAATATLRDMRFNPQRHVAVTERNQVLFEERERAVRTAIALKSEAPGDRRRRRNAFESIRSISEQLASSASDVLRQYGKTAERLRGELADARAAGRRDYFFALHARSRLQRLHDKLASEAGIGV